VTHLICTHQIPIPQGCPRPRKSWRTTRILLACLSEPSEDDDSSSESEEDEDDKTIVSDVDEDQEGLAELLQDAYSQASSAVQEDSTVPL
jgi:hypothetical protein